MTDHPRFQIVTAEPDQRYRAYHGAALVAWVLGAADWWLDRRSPERFFAPRVSEPQATSNQRHPSLMESTP